MSASLQKVITGFGESDVEPTYTFGDGARFMSYAGISFGWSNDFAPTNNRYTWHGLPWPASTPVPLSD